MHMLQSMLVTAHVVQVDVIDAGVEASLQHDTKSLGANKQMRLQKQKVKPGWEFGPKLSRNLNASSLFQFCWKEK